MKIATLAIALCVTTTSLAQTSTPDSSDSARGGPLSGVGVSAGGAWSLSTTTYGAAEYAEIHFPLLLNPRLCIEPTMGFWRVDDSSGDGTSALRLGLAVLIVRELDRIRYYSGPRVAATTWSDGAADHSWVDYWFAAVTGAEYSIGDHLSVGGEVQLTYTLADNGNNPSETYLSTRSLVLVRWYY